jgi:hypothetical protein
VGLEPSEWPFAFAVFAFVFDAFFDFAFAMKPPALLKMPGSQFELPSNEGQCAGAVQQRVE